MKPQLSQARALLKEYVDENRNILRENAQGKIYALANNIHFATRRGDISYIADEVEELSTKQEQVEGTRKSSNIKEAARLLKSSVS